ncbi:acetyl-CoA carboxylase, biotin carboxyl carrier protein [Proteiniborus sp. DW1]|uniref:acetyl-CoA carboxylase biotin carboxyl carrier protein n=1 Tax=Proteiniborus sp. DW1 TaxID=1889883 RepID=UPI00092DFE4F|nr:acetyl-CoA carboxylase biotin carboxyl carrier protein [Proteiniborus sp. DW1]SCG84184.1 acetyl-CoA carboxylase, biotin carboxyl carrier protein [Proteiniborus sp. DW1]
MDIKDIKDLIVAIDKTNIEKVEIEKSDIRIMITKGEGRVSKKISKDNKDMASIEKNSDLENSMELKSDSSDNKENGKSFNQDDSIYNVKSPIVGTFYSSPSPESEPFVKVGDKVEQGQTLCIIEAMKIMNEIECETSGEIIEILVNNEDIVEYGQPLIRIRRS